MQEFFFYSIFGPLFFFFSLFLSFLSFFFFFLPLHGQFFIFFQATKKKKKAENWARRIGLCGPTPISMRAGS